MPASSPDAKRSIRAVLLDAGGVILHPNFDWIAARANELGQHVTRQQLYEAYYRTMREVDLASAPGANPALTSLQVRIWFFGRLLAHAGLGSELAAELAQPLAQLALADFPRESDIYHFAMPGIRQQLEGLLHQGLLLGIASNNDGALIAQLRSTGLLDLFAEAALKDSGVEGVAKPDPELLLRAAAALSVPPEQCLFIGDLETIDGRAAHAAGMSFALLDPLAQQRPQQLLVLTSLAAVLQYFLSSSCPAEYTGER